MNSFLKGFLSIFDWIFPKTLEQSMEDLDNQMQDLYDKMGWGRYNNPCAAHNHSADLTRSLDKMIKMVPSGKFQPYAYYNADMDSIQVYFKDTSSYTQPLNQNVEIHLGHDTEEITGATILNIKQLIEHNK